VDALTGENYKFVIINIARNGANITHVDFAVAAATSPTTAPSYGVDYNLSFPSATTFSISNTATVEQIFIQQLRIWSTGNASLILRNLRGLRSLQMPATILTASLSSTLSRAGNYSIGDVNYGTTTNVQQAHYNSLISSHGNITANSATSVDLMFNECYNLQSVGTINFAIATNIGYFFGNDFALKFVGLITVPNATNYEYFAYACRSLLALRFANSAACTNTTGMISLCTSLQVLHMPNLTRGVNFTGTAIGNYGMNIFASGDGILNGVGTASGAQTITITGTPFGALVTAADATALAIRLVLTTKGYTIAN
jgi:hypothetical protein